MQMTTHFDDAAGRRTHVLRGRLTFPALIANLDAIYRNADYRPDVDSVWDMREADLTAFTFLEVDRIKEFVKNHWAPAGRRRAALVVGRTVDYGFVRMFQSVFQGETSNEVEIFWEMEKALAWLDDRDA